MDIAIHNSNADPLPLFGNADPLPLFGNAEPLPFLGHFYPESLSFISTRYFTSGQFNLHTQFCKSHRSSFRSAW